MHRFLFLGQNPLPVFLLSANDWLIAKEVIQANPVEVILLDDKSPFSIEDIRKEFTGAVVVLVDLDGQPPQHKGADDYILRNELTEGALQAAIQKMLARRETQGTVQAIQDKLNILAGDFPKGEGS